MALVAADAVPAGQCEQLALPRAPLNVPTAHAAHGPPSWPVKPASHRHAAALVLPLPNVCEFAGHRVQMALPASA